MGGRSATVAPEQAARTALQLATIDAGGPTGPLLAGRGRDPVVAAPDIAAYLRIRSAHSPQWLDGGARLAFLSDITGIPQLWAMPAAGGWPDQLTFAAERVSGAVAGGRRRAARVRARRRRQRARPALAGRAGAATGGGRRDPRAGRVLAGRQPLLAFTHTERNGTDFDLAMLDLATGERREWQLEGWNVVCDFTAHGILLARARSNVSHDLFLVDPAGGEPRPLTRTTGPSSTCRRGSAPTARCSAPATAAASSSA